jgi:hypothetical protein
MPAGGREKQHRALKVFAADARATPDPNGIICGERMVRATA